jgi:hypothetical protein
MCITVIHPCGFKRGLAILLNNVLDVMLQPRLAQNIFESVRLERSGQLQPLDIYDAFYKDRSKPSVHAISPNA